MNHQIPSTSTAAASAIPKLVYAVFGALALATAAVPAAAGQQLAQSGSAHTCATCGTVESVQAVKVKGESTGLGLVGGAVAGGLVGHQFGGGSGKTALTVAGAAGGALAGREVERNMRATTVYDVRVRMHDGSVRTFRQSTSIAAGTPVQVEGKNLRVARAAQPKRAG